MIVTRNIRLFITYVKENNKTGEIYAGRASGLVSQIDEKTIDEVRKKEIVHIKKTKKVSLSHLLIMLLQIMMQ